MPTPPLDSDPAFLARLRQAAAEHVGVMAIAAAAGIDRTSCGKYLRKHGIPYRACPAGRPKSQEAPAIPAPAPEPDPAGPPLTRKETATADGGSKIEFVCDRRIQTVDDALDYAEVDRTKWRVHKFEVTSWENIAKVKNADGKGETLVCKSLWRVWLDLRPVLPPPLLAATDLLFARMAEHAPSYPAPPSRRQLNRPHLFVVDLFDVHFGKLAWGPETGQHYDLRIAERVYRNAVQDLTERAVPAEIDRVLLPIGNDFFHIDGIDNQTTAGTQMDTDGRYSKILDAGQAAVLWAIEFLCGLAPVDVVWVPGNHDRHSSECLARVVEAWFRKCPNVTVDRSAPPRKYYRYGRVLLGFTHGNQEKRDKLPHLMATERPADWAETTCHEWHTGHDHQLKSVQTLPVETIQGVEVRTLRSLAGTDSWHHARGFVGSQRAAEAFLYDRDKGWVAHFNANVRE